MTDPAVDRLKQTLRVYDESLLRQVAAKLIKPRNQWPADELIERCCATFDNFASIDRRLKELRPEERCLLAMMGHSGQPHWRVVHIVEMSAALGDRDGIQSVRNLLEAGMLFPDLPENWKRLRSINQWFTQAGPAGLSVFTHLAVMSRAIGEDLGLPTCPAVSDPIGPIQEADGLEWPLRLAALWQLASAEPLRKTQQGEFFKRDQDRLRNDPLLSSPPSDSLFETTGIEFVTADLAAALGILRETDGEWRAAEIPALWDQDPWATLASIWRSLPIIEDRSAMEGNPGSISASVALLFMVFLTRLPEGAWAHPRDIQNWIVHHHPGFKSTNSRSASTAHLLPATNLLLTVAYHLRMIQAAKGKSEEWVIRLSPLSRWMLGLGAAPARTSPPSQTLLVQPNLEIIVYRQGLTAGLIASLSQFAAWKSLGAACLLQLQPETVYRALETGFTFAKIRQTLDQHGTRPTPPAVLDLLQTWTAKRDRLSIYPSATLFEFTNPQDLNDALARGLPAIRLSDRLAVVANEGAIDYRHFRLTGTRDYSLPPEKCVDIEEDGVTLTVEPERSDLLVETELRRFARFLEQTGDNGQRQYRVTPESLGTDQNGGLGMFALEEWFQQRTGQSLSPAIRLLMTAPFQSAAELKQQLVLHVSSTQLADGLMQLPETRGLIQARLGPTALALAPEHAEELRLRIEQLGLAVLPKLG